MINEILKFSNKNSRYLRKEDPKHLIKVKSNTNINQQKAHQKYFLHFKKLYQQQQQRIKILSMQLKAKDEKLQSIQKRILNKQKRLEKKYKKASNLKEDIPSNQYFHLMKKKSRSNKRFKKIAFQTSLSEQSIKNNLFPVPCRSKMKSEQQKDIQMYQKLKMPLSSLKKILNEQILERIKKINGQ